MHEHSVGSVCELWVSQLVSEVSRSEESWNGKGDEKDGTG